MYLKEHNLIRKEKVFIDSLTYNTQQTWVDPVPGEPYKSNEASRLEGFQWKKVVGYDIPEYYSKLKRGELMPHTPWYWAQVNGQSTGSYEKLYKTGARAYSVFNRTIRTDWTLTVDEIRAYAPNCDVFLQNAVSKVYSNGFDALTSLAEFDDVVRLWVNAAKGTINLCKLIDRLESGKSVSKSISLAKWFKKPLNYWLTYRYGVRTLIYDLKDLYETMTAYDESRTRWQERAGTKYTLSRLVKSGEVINSEHKCAFTLTDRVEVEARGSISSDIAVPKFQFAPLRTAWEVVPLSFVVDWIFSVGKAMTAMTYTCSFQNYAASIGYRLIVERQFQYWCTAVTSSLVASVVDAQQGSSLGILEERIPKPVSYFPHYNLQMDWAKVIDLLALFIQRLH